MSSNEEIARGRRRGRGLALKLVLSAAFFLALVELASYLTLRSLGFGDLSERMHQAADVVDGAPERRLGREARTHGIHPYVGFMPLRPPVPAVFEGAIFYEERFYTPDSPIFSRDENELIVGICGGSVAGMFSRFGGSEVLAGSLAARPEYAGHKVRFAVMAMGGAKQPQQLMALNYVLALGGRLDVLINIDGYNEVVLHESDNYRQGVAPIYPRGWFHRVQTVEVTPVVGELNHLARRRRDAALAALHSPLSRLWSRRLVWHLSDARFGAAIGRLNAELQDFEPDERGNLVTMGPASAAQDQDGRLDELADIWRNGSRQLHRLCAANGIEYYHFLQPNQYVTGSKTFTEEELAVAFIDNGKRSVRVNDGYARLREAGAALVAEGVRFHDLTGVFTEVEESVYIDDCCHMNELGNELLGQAVADAMASWGS